MEKKDKKLTFQRNLARATKLEYLTSSRRLKSKYENNYKSISKYRRFKGSI